MQTWLCRLRRDLRRQISLLILERDVSTFWLQDSTACLQEILGVPLSWQAARHARPRVWYTRCSLSCVLSKSRSASRGHGLQILPAKLSLYRCGLPCTFTKRWQIFLLFLFLLWNKDRIVRKYIFRDSIESLKVARHNPAHRIYIIKIKDANAKGSANVLKDFDRVRRRLVLDELALVKAVFIVLRLCVSNWNLTFMLPSSLDDFRSQSIDSASTCIIALQSVTVRDAC